MMSLYRACVKPSEDQFIYFNHYSSRYIKIYLESIIFGVYFKVISLQFSFDLLRFFLCRTLGLLVHSSSSTRASQLRIVKYKCP